jgi:hypothetical protein
MQSREIYIKIRNSTGKLCQMLLSMSETLQQSSCLPDWEIKEYILFSCSYMLLEKPQKIINIS